MTLMILGTSSNAGKTTVCAFLCRHFTKKGLKIIPYKASNLSLNSYVTESGAEIGIGQALQAWACNTEPEAEMNPVLIKPSGDGRLQYVLNGKVYSNEGKPSKELLMNEAVKAFDKLKEKGKVICEGSGAPAELNLMDRDIANIGIMKEKEMNAILVGDIERGGVFAAIYGTWLLIPDELKPKMKGFIINRFRGDITVLESGIKKIEELTGMRYLGTMPYVELTLPEEDTISFRNRKNTSDDIHTEYLNSLDLLSDIAGKELDMDYIESIL